jgi:hypothetical protein
MVLMWWCPRPLVFSLKLICRGVSDKAQKENTQTTETKAYTQLILYKIRVEWILSFAQLEQLSTQGYNRLDGWDSCFTNGFQWFLIHSQEKVARTYLF